MLLRGLFESRVMTAAHVAALYFDGRKEAAKKRLQKLKATEFIRERKRRVNEPAVLFLTRKGFALLTERKAIADLPRLSTTAFEKRANVSTLTIRHELEVMDVKAAFYSALKNSETFSIAEYSTWPLLHQFRAKRPGQEPEVLVKPDGFIRIQEQEKDGGVSEHTFFLEVDRSTETQATLVARAGCYLDYYKSGGFALAHGKSPGDYKDFPFRLLVVLKSAERRNNTAERMLQTIPPIRTLAYLATLSEILANPVGSVWIRPGDYGDVVKRRQPGRPMIPRSYLRQSERELFVESNIDKLSLF